MKRTPEPELMDSLEQTVAYAAANFSEPNTLFCDHTAAFLSTTKGRLLDLGCGSGGLLLQLANTLPMWSMLGVDAGPNMLSLARDLVTEQQAQARIELLQAHLPTDCPAVQSRGPFDAIVCNSLLHHLENPMTLWESIRTLGHSGTQVVVMDLTRPQSKEDAMALVEAHTQGAAEILKQDFYNSLLAAWREDEIRDQLDAMGWTDWSISAVSNRHWMVKGQLP